MSKLEKNNRIKIAVIGAGAIGSLVAGYLKLKEEDVSLIGHLSSIQAIKKKGLTIVGARGNFNVNIDVFEKLNQTPNLVILAVKTQDIEEALENNLNFLKDSCILTIQNGIQAENIVSKYIAKENIISSIIMFGSTYLEPAKVVHNFEGEWIVDKTPPSKELGGSIPVDKTPPSKELGGSIPMDKTVCSGNNSMNKIHRLLSKIFPIVLSNDIKGMKYLKIFVNANNCITAVLGLSMQEAFSDLEISRISIAIWREGLDIIKKNGITLVSLPNFSLERLTGLLALPAAEAAEKFSAIMINLSEKPLYGSILQSIKRNRSSEIDYINGEFVNLAEKNNLKAPLNKKLVEMVHSVEKSNKFFSKEELVMQTEKFVN